VKRNSRQNISGQARQKRILSQRDLPPP
jgi:hypothetical protein